VSCESVRVCVSVISYPFALHIVLVHVCVQVLRELQGKNIQALLNAVRDLAPTSPDYLTSYSEVAEVHRCVCVCVCVNGCMCVCVCVHALVSFFCVVD
jgi:hypothetical protein